MAGPDNDPVGRAFGVIEALKSPGGATVTERAEELDGGSDRVDVAVSPDGFVDAGEYERGAVERAYEFGHTVGVASVSGGNGSLPRRRKADDPQTSRWPIQGDNVRISP